LYSTEFFGQGESGGSSDVDIHIHKNFGFFEIYDMSSWTKRGEPV